MAYRVRYGGNEGFKLGVIGYLIVINFIMVIVTTIRPDLLNTLGLPSTFNSIHTSFFTVPGFVDQPWSIITSMFVHANLWHFLTNMITLFFFGNYLLQLVGQTKFLIIYFLSGLMGGLMYILIANGGIAVGASGAIFGVAGALVVMQPKLRVFIIPIPVPIPLWAAVLGGFVLMSFSGGIAWEAHLGGLVLGAAAGYLFKRRPRRYY